MKKIFLLLLFTFSFDVYSQNLISVPFSNGFVGDNTANNSASNCYYLTGGSGLGWSNVQFAQNSTSTIFVAQGNDILGMVLITDNNGVEHTINGFIKWRTPSGGSPTTPVFQPQVGTNVTLATNSLNGSSTYLINETKYIGLTFNGSTLTISPVPGTVTGNAATNGLLDLLNSYLGLLPKISIQDAIVNENDGNILITVTLSASSSDNVSVNYSTSDNSALSVVDYTSAIGSITFTPGQVSKTFSIPILDDFIPETLENFTITLTDPTNAAILDGIGLVSIVDNDTCTISTPSGSVTVQPTCASATGTIVFTPQSGVEFSIDGTTYQASNTFIGVAPGNYTLRVRSTTDNSCTATGSSLTVINGICATDDTVGPINGFMGSTTVSVLQNDTLNGLVVIPSQITLTGIIVPTGLTLNPSGTITIPANTPAGTYTVTYEICEVSNPTNCSTTTATLVVGTCLSFPINDCDNDGESNGVETTNGTNPNDPCSYTTAPIASSPAFASWSVLDCDGDGTPNVSDTAPSNPCVYAPGATANTSSPIWAAADCDNDGESNGVETTNGTNPNDPCSYTTAPIASSPAYASWSVLDCDGDGTPNISDTAPNNPCVYAPGATANTSNPIWAAADCDNDGESNGVETTNGTNPNDPCSYTTAPIASSPAYASWSVLDCDGDGTPNISDTAPNNPCVYAPGATANTSSPIWAAADCDNDGESNGVETTNGTNPNDPCSYTTAPIASSPAYASWSVLDCDGDGTPNISDTAPNNPCVYAPGATANTSNPIWAAADCDNDGESNGVETTNGTNPNDPCSYTTAPIASSPAYASWSVLDCDGDGTPNISDTAPNNPCVYAPGATANTSNPIWAAADCDNDGESNGVETTNGTNPNDPCSYTTAPIASSPAYASWSVLDCDGDGTPNVSDTAPNNPCVYAPGATANTSSPIWAAADCDNDGESNGVETTNGTNPNDPCSYTIAPIASSPAYASWSVLDCDGDGTPNISDTAPNNPCVYAPGATANTSSPIWAAADCDNDGESNGVETTNGTNPNDPCSYTTAPIASSPAYASWSVLDCDGDGTPNVSDTAPNNPCVYAPGATANTSNPIWAAADCDNDGESNGVETTNGTNPNDPCSYTTAPIASSPAYASWSVLDCDGDGTPNVSDTAPNNPCVYAPGATANTSNPIWAAADCDNDGESNGVETTNGTNPNDPCSYTTAPIASSPAYASWSVLDCDGDGVTNSQEIIDGTDPLNPCQSLPINITLPLSTTFLNGDCDGDGLLNEEEIGLNIQLPNDSNNNGISDYLEVNNSSPSNDDLEIFNAITPNGNGENDVFVIRNIENYPNNSVKIYNRWGVIVYDVDSYGQDNKFFRGISEGRITINRNEELPIGTYFYIIRYVNLEGVEKQRSGYLFINK